ncbi:hypothetical protein E2C01_036584 [Portunus trituberculatus]|uniref:Uncharacterized protein n=1 Tax=Portunus trituberculatus TaxID=210409 RepID=A0A5B7FCG5_PORTR|nr:hypothetical protein [Portunus trituberculatus]
MLASGRSTFGASLRCSGVGFAPTFFLTLFLVCQYCGTRVRKRMPLDLVSINLLVFKLSLMTDLAIVSTTVYSFRLPRVGYWELPDVSLCPPAMDGKKDFPPALFHTRCLERYSTHSEAIPVFTDDSKFDAELSAIVLALQIIVTLPVSSL